MWDDSKYIAFDFETSGTLPEYALQPWRVAQGKAWVTSLATVRKVPNDLTVAGGLAVGMPHAYLLGMIHGFLTEAIDNNWTIVGWNVAFDISWLLAYGFEKEVRQLKFLDGMLLWRHLTIEPEYDTVRHKKKSYRLKEAVREELPQFAGYEEDVDFHATDPESLAKLHEYNIRDTMFTLRLTRTYYNLLAQEPQRLRAALIEADCLVDVAKANLIGMLVDVPTTQSLGNRLVEVADDMLLRLGPHGVTEKVVRSPKQLSKLLFETWGLPVLKQNTSKLTGNTTDSTDKEVLHELSFIDSRAAEIRLYREALGNKTKFVDAPLKSVEYNEDGKTHPIAMVFGTYCVPGDVEVLTRNGWERLDVWQGGEIAQVHPDLTIEFLAASRFIGPMTDTWVHMHQRSFDCMFTPGHTVAYLKQKTFQWATTHAGQMVGSGEAKYIPVAGHVTLAGQYTPEQMRVFAAVQADGCSSEKELKFVFKKVRKIERLRQLLHACGIAHREYVCAAYPERVEFHIPKRSRPHWLGHDKKHFGSWLLDTTYDGLVAFVDELVYWDGSPHADGGVRYVSKTEENVTWVTTAAALIGRKASRHTLKADMYSCHISLPTTRACKTIKPTRDVTEVTQTARAYCATTQTGFWLARSNGHIFVTGNTSRMTYASKQGRNKDERQIGFALHQMKRGKDFRSIITAPPGYTLMEFDAAGQEFRWMAIASGDETMLELCQPGEDPHGFMGARIRHMDYRELVQKVHDGDKDAKDGRQLGKVANLSCIAAGQKVLTDRGFCCIEDVTLADKLWDGEAWVTHSGVIYQGVKNVIEYEGVTATQDHEVRVAGNWVTLEDAARYGWQIESSLGAGWTYSARSAVRIVEGIVRRTILAVRGAIRNVPLQVWCGKGSESTVYGDRQVNTVQRVCLDSKTSQKWQADCRHVGQEATTKTCERRSTKMYERIRQGICQLRRTRYTVQVCIREGCRGLHTAGTTAAEIVRWLGHGQDRRKRSLRAGEHPVCYTERERGQQATYDILNAGDRLRFSVGFSLVHNCQYRTSAKKLRVVARVQYNLPMDLPEAERLHSTYQQTYPGVPRYWRNQIALTKRLGYVETFAGRRVQVVGNWSGTQGWSMESTAINYRIQGTGGDQKYLALSVLKPYITRIGAVFAWELHDGIYFYVPDAMVERAATEIPYLLANLPYKKAWGFTPPIPLPWDCKWGSSWGTLTEWKGK